MTGDDLSLPTVTEPKAKKPKAAKASTFPNLNPEGRKVGSTGIYDPVLKRARAKLATEMKLRGVPQPEITKALGISKALTSRILKWSVENGVVEEVRQSMQAKLLPKVEKFFTQIMDTDEATIADKSVYKGYDLKLKAVTKLGEGLGALRKSPATEAKQTAKMDFQGYLALRESRQQPSLKQIVSESLEGDVIDVPTDPDPDPTHS